MIERELNLRCPQFIQNLYSNNDNKPTKIIGDINYCHKFKEFACCSRDDINDLVSNK